MRKLDAHAPTPNIRAGAPRAVAKGSAVPAAKRNIEHALPPDEAAATVMDDEEEELYKPDAEEDEGSRDGSGDRARGQGLFSAAVFLGSLTICNVL